LVSAEQVRPVNAVPQSACPCPGCFSVVRNTHKRRPPVVPQMARMEEMTAGEGEPPPDPRDVDEWAWDTEEVRDFHRALEVRLVVFRCKSTEHQVFSLHFQRM